MDLAINLLALVLGSLVALGAAAQKDRLDPVEGPSFNRTTDPLFARLRISWHGKAQHEAVALLVPVYGEAGDLVHVNYRLVVTSDDLYGRGVRLETNARNGALLVYSDATSEPAVQASGGYNVGPGHHSSFDRTGNLMLAQPCPLEAASPCHVVVVLSCHSRGERRYMAVRRKLRLPRYPTCEVAGSSFLEAINLSSIGGSEHASQD